MSESNVPSNLWALIREIEDRVDRETDLLTDDEIRARLNGERPIKIKPKSFRRRISEADHIHARAFGIKL